VRSLGEILEAWAVPISKAALKLRPGRSVKLRLDGPAPGRLEIQVVDRRRKLLSRGIVYFAAEERKTVTLRRARRGKPYRVFVKWRPRTGTPITANWRL
jgi:hypothetical protein